MGCVPSASIIRVNGRLQPASWSEALALVASKLKSADPKRIGAIAGDLAGAEEMFALKDLFARLGSANIDCRQDGAMLDPALGRASYIFNSTIAGLSNADAVLMIGTNPRVEAPVLNSRLLTRWRGPGVSVGVIGEKVALTYPSEYLGAGPDTLNAIASGQHPFAATLNNAKAPMVIVGQGALARADGAAVLALAQTIAAQLAMGKGAGFEAFNVLHTAAARVAGLDLCFVPGQGGLDTAAMLDGRNLDSLYLLGADEVDLSRLGSTFVIYQGSHGDAGAHRADVVFPGAAYTEKSATYVNTEGRVQQTVVASFPPGEAKEDWTILRALSATAGQTLPYDNLAGLRAAMYKAAPVLARLNTIATAGPAKMAAAGALGSEPFMSSVRDFYLTNAIARASGVMAEMSALKAASTGKLRAAE
jgi:NADH-quinone oxidoreductase subunit G